MYTLEPYSPKQAVHPAPIMYKMNSYHAPNGVEDVVSALSTGVGDISLLETDEQRISREIQQIRTTQRSIVAELQALEKQLKAMNLKNAPASGKQSNAKNQKDEKPKSANTKATQKPTPSKQDHENKATKSPKAAKSSPPKKQDSSATTFATSPTIAHAGVSVSCRVFPVHNYDHNNNDGVGAAGSSGKLKFMVKRVDFAWVRLLAEVGRSRGVKFTITEGKNGKNAHVAVEFYRTGTDKDYPLNTKVEKWKTLGKILSLFCAEDSTILPATDEWLRLASELEAVNDGLTRKLCRHLSANDFLCGCNAICLADLVVRAFFHDTNTKLVEWRSASTSNNVQLWLKRVDEALAAMKQL